MGSQIGFVSGGRAVGPWMKWYLRVDPKQGLGQLPLGTSVEAQSYASPVNSTPSFLKVVRIWFVSARMVRKRSKAENPNLRPDFSI